MGDDAAICNQASIALGYQSTLRCYKQEYQHILDDGEMYDGLDFINDMKCFDYLIAQVQDKTQFEYEVMMMTNKSSMSLIDTLTMDRRILVVSATNTIKKEKSNVSG